MVGRSGRRSATHCARALATFPWSQPLKPQKSDRPLRDHLGLMPRHIIHEYERCVAVSKAANSEQRARAAASMILAAPFGLPFPPRQQRLAAVECLDLAPLVDAEHHRSVRRSHPTMSHVFSSNGGSVEKFKVRHQPAVGGGPADAVDRRGGVADGSLPQAQGPLHGVGGLVSSVRPIVFAVPFRRSAAAR